jgi:hypothetical protein
MTYTDGVIKDRARILRNNHQYLGINVACPTLEESHISYAKHALPQAGIYYYQIGSNP